MIEEILNPNNIYTLTDICSQWFNNFETFIIKNFIKIIIIYIIYYIFSFYKGKNKIINKIKSSSNFLNTHVPFVLSMITIDYYMQNKYNIQYINYIYLIIIIVILGFLLIYFRKDVKKLFKFIKENMENE